MTTLHLVSHTHWDREWYQPFQVFRFKLVQLIDHVLDLIASDSGFKYFMLDGQTIVLEDYLQMRPERETELRSRIEEGKILIGPWHILPDEFLVSPEAIIRNLLLGDRTARRFGPKMQVGYIPDPFGHIGQMPQILRGFMIGEASLQRGLDDQPLEFWWEAPDGSRVLMAYLRDGYGNAALLPTARPEEFTRDILRLRDSLQPHTATQHILLMHGTDHTAPPFETSAAISGTAGKLDGDTLIHSTLPAYIEAIKQAIQAQNLDLPTLQGELRSSKRFHLLPGVLSTRMWIKQRNRACETLLEKWAEPFATFAERLALQQLTLAGGTGSGTSSIQWDRSGAQAAHTGTVNPAPLLRQAWRYLLENQPHDSVCGCSIDQVHEEMRPRFDQAEQLGEELTRQSLSNLTAAVDTHWTDHPLKDPFWPVVVFNPHSHPVTGQVQLRIPFPAWLKDIQVFDQSGAVMPAWVGESALEEIAYMVLDRSGFMDILGSIQGGRVTGIGPVEGSSLQEATFKRIPNGIYITAILAEAGEPSPENLATIMEEISQVLADAEVGTFILKVFKTSTPLQFVAQEVPPLGRKTFWVTPLRETLARQETPDVGSAISNEFLTVQLEQGGTLRLEDRRTGAVYSGLNRFVDGGDCGDLYNFTPPVQDLLVSQAEVLDSRVVSTPVYQALTVRLNLLVPERIDPDRQKRSKNCIPLQVTTEARLYPGVPRLDIHTQVNNQAEDHRLRVHFPAPFAVSQADFDGHFEVVTRSLSLPEADQHWAEQPRPEMPQRSFTSISDQHLGLTIANRGLPEVEVLEPSSDQGHNSHSEIAITLLRCTGWLSRDDLWNRKGHAGPGYPTPGGQVPGEWEFDYGVIPHPRDWRSQLDSPYSPAHLAYEFSTPLRGEPTGDHPGQLSPDGSFLSISSPKVVITAVKPVEEGTGWIVRGVNLIGDPVSFDLQVGLSFERAWKSNLLEERLVPMSSRNNTLSLEVRGHEIFTLRLE